MEYKNLTDYIFFHDPQHIFEEELITLVTTIYRMLIMYQTAYKRILFHVHFPNKETNSQKI